MRKIAVIGFGEMGRQVLELARAIFVVEEVAVFDDEISRHGRPNAYAFEEYRSDEFAGYDFLLGLGYKHLALKHSIVRELDQLGRALPVLKHPSSFVHPSACLGKAVYLYPLCNVDKGVFIGEGTLLNNSVTVSHDNHIKNCCYLSPGVTTSGFVEIGHETFLGTGTAVANNLKIGSNVTVGIGSVVTRSLPDGCSAFGNPARLLPKKLVLR